MIACNMGIRMGYETDSDSELATGRNRRLSTPGAALLLFMSGVAAADQVKRELIEICCADIHDKQCSQREGGRGQTPEGEPLQLGLRAVRSRSLGLFG